MATIVVPVIGYPYCFVFCSSKLRGWHRLQSAETGEYRWSHTGDLGGVWTTWGRGCFHQHQIHGSHIRIVYAKLIAHLFDQLPCEQKLHISVMLSLYWCVCVSTSITIVLMMKAFFRQSIELCIWYTAGIRPVITLHKVLKKISSSESSYIYIDIHHSSTLLPLSCLYHLNNRSPSFHKISCSCIFSKAWNNGMKIEFHLL